MSLEVIYVVRHGFRTGWLVDPNTGIYSASIRPPTGIPADPALTSHGVVQAKELGQHLMKLDPPIDVVYSSPYYRCLQTITPFVELKQDQLKNEPNGCDVTASIIRPEYGLCEWFGSAPFEHPIPASAEVLKAKFPAYDTSYVSALSPSRRGETVEELYERVRAAVQAIINRCDAEGRRAVVLCTHAAVVITLGRVLTGCIPESVETDDFGAFTCGLSLYRRQGLQGTSNPSGSPTSEAAVVGGWECELNSDCSFLSSGEERGWRFAGDESFPGTGSMSQAHEASKL
ncbi:Fc.00g111760.m01.CDS01 [Cosmosporella sp. VM-42]